MNKKISLITACAAVIVIVLSVVLVLLSQSQTTSGSAENTKTTASNTTEQLPENTGANMDSAANHTGQTTPEDKPYAEEQVVITNRDELGDLEASGNGVTPTESVSGTTGKNEPTDTQPADTKPAQNGPEKISYEAYLAMSPQQQEAYFLLFADPQDYIAWLNEAKLEYEKNQNTIIATGEVDLGDIANP